MIVIKRVVHQDKINYYFHLAIYFKNMQKRAINYTTEFHGHKTNLLNNAGMSQLHFC